MMPKKKMRPAIHHQTRKRKPVTMLRKRKKPSPQSKQKVKQKHQPKKMMQQTRKRMNQSLVLALPVIVWAAKRPGRTMARLRRTGRPSLERFQPS